MDTTVDEIGVGIYRLSTWIPDITEHGFTLFHPGLTTNLQPTLELLAELNPATLALMHGASFAGDGAAQLRALADGYAVMAGASLQ